MSNSPEGWLNLVNLLVFTMPGFFFVRAFSRRKITSEFEYFMFSLFWGIVLLMLFYKFLPAGKLDPVIANPYAGAIILSTLGWLIGHMLGSIKGKFS